jgi:hypothetical protein
VLILLIGAAAATPGSAQEVVDHKLENSVKVAYLYGFGRYVQWPESALGAEQKHFVIGVVGHDPTGGLLDQLARKKRIQDRPIAIRHIESIAEAAACHMLFLPAEVPEADCQKLLEGTAGQPVLTVGESVNFLALGGVVTFFRQSGTIRFAISAEAAKVQGVSIDAKLLSLARSDPR